jgi:hypothetical protein
MKRALQATAIALAVTVSLSAQDTTVKSKTKVKADNAKTMTIVGCVEGGHGSAFTLSHVTPGMPAAAPIGTTGAETITGYTIVPRTGLDLSAHVGHQVQITALVAKSSDDKMKAKEKVKAQIVLDDEPDATVKQETKVEGGHGTAHGTMPVLTVMSVKHLAASCPM